jgi:Ran GTPase-activating protein (RanGAP) involved in mRNA processing and transport
MSSIVHGIALGTSVTPDAPDTHAMSIAPETSNISVTSIAPDMRNMSNTPVSPGPFIIALITVLAKNWQRTWCDKRTIMMRNVSTTVRNLIDNMGLPIFVCLANKWTVKDEEIGFMNKISVFSNSYKITTLDIHYCKIKMIIEDLQKALRQCSNLECLKLSNNNIGDEEVLRLTEAFKQCRMLKLLDLSINNIGKAGAKMLENALSINTTLIHLNLEMNYVEQEGANSISRLMTNENLKSIAYINLSENHIFCEGAISLASAINKQNQSLTHLDLSNNSIEKGFESLALALERCENLKYLNLNGNWIDSYESLSGVLVQCKLLKHLDLGYNSIRLLESNSFINELGQCSLICLELPNNNICDEGIVKLIGKLKLCRTLKKLNLSENNISDKGAEILSRALIDCDWPELKELNLSSNKIDNKGVESIAYALTYSIVKSKADNTTLTKLDLNFNWFDDIGLNILNQALKSCASLKCSSMFCYNRSSIN